MSRTCSTLLSWDHTIWAQWFSRRCRPGRPRTGPNTAESVRSGIGTYSKLQCVSFIGRVDLFHIVLCVLDYDLMGVTIELENNGNEVLFSIFDPPAGEVQVLYLVCMRRIRVELPTYSFWWGNRLVLRWGSSQTLLHRRHCSILLWS